MHGRCPMRMPRQHMTPSKGFSLVELTVVVAMIAVLGALAAPRFANASSRQRVAAAANRVEADLMLARQRARAASADYTVRFKADAYEFVDADGRSQQITDLSKEPYGVSIRIKLTGPNQEIVFNGFGLPDHGAAITLTGGGYSSVVMLDQTTGEVTRP